MHKQIFLFILNRDFTFAQKNYLFVSDNLNVSNIK